MRLAALSVVFTVPMMVGAGAASSARAGQKAPPKVEELAKGELAKLAAQPAIVKAVKDENAKRKTLDQIKAMDQKWQKTPGVADFMKALMDNTCAQALKDAAKADPALVEMFVVDNQGANVCQTNKTSDYWQGDEDKFSKCFLPPKGAVYLGEVKFDDSTQSYVSQVSLPVLDGDTQIGVLVVGVDVEKVN